jgi:anti-sigma B factor antagonist
MDIKTYDKATLLTLIERVDSVTSREVETALQGVVGTGTSHVICDCGPTKYISSAGLRVLLSAAKNMKKAGGRLSLVCSKHSYAFEVLETAGFTNIIPVFESVDEALRPACS